MRTTIKRIAIVGNGSVGGALVSSLKFRGVHKYDLVCYDTKPERSSTDESGFAAQIADLDAVFCCVDTPARKARTDPDERYDLYGVFECIRLLFQNKFDGLLVIRTTISPEDVKIIDTLCDDLGTKFYPIYWPVVAPFHAEEGETLQPTLAFLGVDKRRAEQLNQPFGMFLHWLNEVFPDIKQSTVAVANPMTVLGVVQMINTTTAVYATALREYQTLWSTYEKQPDDGVASFDETIEMLVKTGLLTDVLISGIRMLRGEAQPESFPEHVVEDLNAVSWESKMKEKSCWVINAAARRVTLDNEVAKEDAAKASTQSPPNPEP